HLHLGVGEGGLDIGFDFSPFHTHRKNPLISPWPASEPATQLFLKLQQSWMGGSSPPMVSKASWWPGFLPLTYRWGTRIQNPLSARPPAICPCPRAQARRRRS